MNRLRSLVCLSSLAVFSFACSPKDTGEEMQIPPVDVRVPIPAADPKFVNFVGAERIIAIGEDSMTCTHQVYTGEDLAYDLADSEQGKFGHHFVILRAKQALPAGSVEDCSKPEDMGKYDLLTIPDFELPTNHAFMLKKGTQIVMQSHYVNTGKTPILVRDTLRFRKVETSKVATWASAFASALGQFGVKPGQQASESYDCVVPQDYQLMMVGGHMHEWGKKFMLSYAATPADPKMDLYRVDEWMAHHRDAPPTLLMKEKPMNLRKGAVFNASCTWFNDTQEVLSYPREMCTIFGVLLGSQEPWLCKVGF